MDVGLSVDTITQNVNDRFLEDRYHHLDNDKLLQSFRHLSLLLTLLSAVCDVENRPSFNCQAVAMERMARLRNNRPGRVLDAAVTLLVRNKEVIAGMTYNLDSEDDPPKTTTSLLALKADSSSDASESNGGQVESGRDDFEDAPSLQGDGGLPLYEPFEKVLNVAAIANPIGFKNEVSDIHLCLPTLSGKGISHWPNFEADVIK
jgi:hypothetical protein